VARILIDFVVSFGAAVCAGVPLGALAGLLAWVVGRRLHIFERAEQRKERRQRDTLRAAESLEDLRDEVADLIEKVPQWRGAMTSVEWGKVFNISTPIWDGIQHIGGVERSASREVVQRLARFYGGLSQARTWVRVVGESWMVAEDQVVNAGAKRTAFAAMAVQGLDQARNAGEGLVEMLDWEIERLRGQLKALGWDVPGDAERGEDEEEQV